MLALARGMLHSPGSDNVARRTVMGMSVEARGIAKSFGHVHALRGVDLTVGGGEIVALLGDNGAGKSTLVRILSGVHRADRGEVLLDGEPVTFDSTYDAQAAGVDVVYQ